MVDLGMEYAIYGVVIYGDERDERKSTLAAYTPYRPTLYIH